MSRTTSIHDKWRMQSWTEPGRGSSGKGLRSLPHVCEGEPAEALLTIAADQQAQMIVVGNRGMAGARRVLGSVPNRLSHGARCGVLIVPTS